MVTMYKKPNRKDPAKHREQVRAGNRAKYAAAKILISRHQREYEAIYEACCVSEGVVPVSVRRREKEQS